MVSGPKCEEEKIDLSYWQRAVSSVGRALPRHGRGHWFEPNTAHHFLLRLHLGITAWNAGFQKPVLRLLCSLLEQDLVSEMLADAVKKSSQPRQCQVACLILFGRQKITAFLSIKTASFGVDETSQDWWYQHQLLVRNLCRGAKRHYFCLQTCFI